MTLFNVDVPDLAKIAFSPPVVLSNVSPSKVLSSVISVAPVYSAEDLPF